MPYDDGGKFFSKSPVMCVIQKYSLSKIFYRIGRKISNFQEPLNFCIARFYRCKHCVRFDGNELALEQISEFLETNDSISKWFWLCTRSKSDFVQTIEVWFREYEDAALCRGFLGDL